MGLDSKDVENPLIAYAAPLDAPRQEHMDGNSTGALLLDSGFSGRGHITKTCIPPPSSQRKHL
jgi:hypothetical protein